MAKYKKLKLSKGFYAIVDEEDYEYLAQFRWAASVRSKSGHVYAISYKAGLLHRFLTKAPPGTEVDHKNRDTLDYRKQNLRVVDHCINQHNRKLSKRNKSGFTGVCWSTQKNKWQAAVLVRGVRKHLGFFDHPEEASSKVAEYKKQQRVV